MPCAVDEVRPNTRLRWIQESVGVRRLISGRPAFATAGYDPGNTVWDFVRVLVVGAGGIGCELLHLLALSGFGELTVMDLDTVELSNLNRQFLFRREDIGQPKSLVAARRVMERCPGVTVTGIVGRIENQSDDFYRGFDVIVMGLDSVDARHWMNAKVAQLATWEVVEDSHGCGAAGRAVLRITRAIPMIDTGTEGLQGHVKTIDMSLPNGSCLECQKWMYANPRRQVPMCTLENIPRTPEHCVLYVQFYTWPTERGEGGEVLDGDNVAHIRWVTERARERQRQFGIGGPPIDETFTLGVVKNVIPAVSSTNAMVAGMAVTEIMKWLTGVAPMLDNYYLYCGAASAVDVAIPGAQHLGGSSECAVCGPRPVVSLRLDMSPVEVRAAVADVGCAADPTAAASARCGTLWLQYTARATGAVKEVPLVFKENSPYATPIHGSTVGEILASSGAEDLLAEWAASPSVRAPHEATQTIATALLTLTGSATISVAVRCVS